MGSAVNDEASDEAARHDAARHRTALHVTGKDAGTGEPIDLTFDGERVVGRKAVEDYVTAGDATAAAASGSVAHYVTDATSVGPVGTAIELSGYVLPGFVDAHCHVGYSSTGAVSLAEAERQARRNLAAGVLVIRDCGSPIDTSSLAGRDDLPVLIRAGRHIARPKRYIRDLAVDLEDPADLVAEVARQAARGSGWVKIVGDWIDRSIGDLAPLWPDDILAEAFSRAHRAGARVTAHVFGEDALPGLLAAGIDCIEHGTGLTDDTIDEMVRRGTHLVPTMINIANFPQFADAADRYPAYAKHMRDLHQRSDATFGAAVDAGIAVHAGTDAGGYIEHGRIVDELTALTRTGMDRRTVLRAASHDARAWLGEPAYSRADCLVFDADPGGDLEILRHPLAVIRSGRIVTGSASGRVSPPMTPMT